MIVVIKILIYDVGISRIVESSHSLEGTKEHFDVSAIINEDLLIDILMSNF